MIQGTSKSSDFQAPCRQVIRIAGPFCPPLSAPRVSTSNSCEAYIDERLAGGMGRLRIVLYSLTISNPLPRPAAPTQNRLPSYVLIHGLDQHCRRMPRKSNHTRMAPRLAVETRQILTAGAKRPTLTWECAPDAEGAGVGCVQGPGLRPWQVILLPFGHRELTRMMINTQAIW